MKSISPLLFRAFSCFFVANPFALFAAEPIRLTSDGHLKQRPVWSPDGKSLLFTRHQGATIFLYVLNTEDKSERRLTMGKDPEFDAAYSPDGKRIAFSYVKAAPNQGDIDVNSCLADGTDIKVV